MSLNEEGQLVFTDTFIDNTHMVKMAQIRSSSVITLSCRFSNNNKQIYDEIFLSREEWQAIGEAMGWGFRIGG